MKANAGIYLAWWETPETTAIVLLVVLVVASAVFAAAKRFRSGKIARTFVEQFQSLTKSRRKPTKFDVVLDNMTQGVVLFDASERAVLFNRRYAELSGLSIEYLKPGRTLHEILQARQALGRFPSNIEDYCRDLRTDLQGNKTNSIIIKAGNGRSCRVTNVPLVDGGWIATHEDITEQEIAKNIVERKTLQLNVALANMSQGISMFDASRRLIICNEQYAELYRLNKQQTIPGTTLESILECRNAAGAVPDDCEGFVDGRIADVASNEPFDSIDVLKDGRSISVKCRPMADGGWVATHEDITELKQREESFRLLFEENPIPMWVIDRDKLTFLAVNQAAIDHYGYSREQFLSMTVFDIRADDDRNHVVNVLRPRFDRGINGTFASRHMKADGTIIEVLAYSKAMIYNGRHARLGAFHDVTNEKNAEAKLREITGFLDAVIEHVPLPIIVKDVSEADSDPRNVRFTLFNRAYEQLTGHSRQLLVGKTAHQIFPKERADLIVRTDEELLRLGHDVVVGEHLIDTMCNGARLVTAKKRLIQDDLGSAKYLLTVVDDITDRRRAEERIRYLAHVDSLTGVPNRATLIERLEEWIRRAKKESCEFSILSVDLDHFKEVNDTYGHLAGDALLQEATKRMQAASDGAFLARLGGDEFMLIVDGQGGKGTATTIADRLISALRAVINIEGCDVMVGATVGGAVFPSDGANVNQLMANADIALYRAKESARGTVLFYEPGMGEEQRLKRELQADLRATLDKNELYLHYQPQKTIDGIVMGFEALVRWQCQNRGMVSPETFIPVAEEAGLIVQIDEWVLREACREAATWPNRLSVAVNISPTQFQTGDFAGYVHAVLLETGLPAARLEIEVTESVLIDDFSRAISILCRLKALGVRIALDDFGTGYSSMSYLHAFPFDKIKIDRAFIRDVEVNNQSAAIVRAIVTLGHGLHVPVLAEGVENESQLTTLAKEGCDQIQGYFIGRPAAIQEYADLVGRDARQRSAFGAIAG